MKEPKQKWRDKRKFATTNRTLRYGADEMAMGLNVEYSICKRVLSWFQTGFSIPQNSIVIIESNIAELTVDCRIIWSKYAVENKDEVFERAVLSGYRPKLLSDILWFKGYI